MKRFKVMLNCGCCDAIVLFEDNEQAQEALFSLGLTSSGTLTDGTGEVITSVDTFYGIHEETEYDEKMNSQGQLGVLFEQLKKLSE